MKQDPEATMIVAPSDHFVADDEEFQRVSLQATAFVEHMKSLITLGINPHIQIQDMAIYSMKQLLLLTIFLK